MVWPRQLHPVVLICYPMIVSFTRAGKRRYRVSTEGSGFEPLYIEPVPGYRDRLPHDAAHFIVENELPILNGIFGQVAASRTAKSFRSEEMKKPRKKKRQGQAVANSNRNDKLLSEDAVDAARSRWERQNMILDTKIQNADIARLFLRSRRFPNSDKRLQSATQCRLSGRHCSNHDRGVVDRYYWQTD
jgi:hypothetical protein